jgi:putative FmdB family regulatory protein
MPIYEYKCSLCGHQLEALQKFSDAPLTLCPECKKEGLTKLISAAGFQLKGSGWYATDYKKQPTEKKKEESKAEGTIAKESKSTQTGGSNNSEAV